MVGVVRTLEAKRALNYAEELIDNDFIINLPIKTQKLYGPLLHKIASYLDGNTNVIKDDTFFSVRKCRS